MISHALKTQIYGAFNLTPTHAGCNHYSMSDLCQRTKRGTCISFSTPKHGKYPNQPFLKIYLMHPHPTQMVFYLQILSSFLTLLLQFHISAEMKSKTPLFALKENGKEENKKAGGGRGIWLVVMTHKQGLICRSLCPPEKLVNAAWTAGRDGGRKQEAHTHKLTFLHIPTAG